MLRLLLLWISAVPADSGSSKRRFIRELLRRFTGWRVMTEKFDLIVSGTGTAARVAAMRTRAAERSVARVLGAHLVGPHADEVINLFALAIRHGLIATALKQTTLAYPTGASDIGYML